MVATLFSRMRLQAAVLALYALHGSPTVQRLSTRRRARFSAFSAAFFAAAHSIRACAAFPMRCAMEAKMRTFPIRQSNLFTAMLAFFLTLLLAACDLPQSDGGTQGEGKWVSLSCRSTPAFDLRRAEPP
jgi:hypothetical protein